MVRNFLRIVSVFLLAAVAVAATGVSTHAEEVVDDAGRDPMEQAIDETGQEIEAAAEEAAPGVDVEVDDSGVAAYAYELFDIGGFPVTNAMVMSWVISIIIILAFRAMARRPQMIPTKGQAIAESMVGWIRDLIEPIVGKHMVYPTFPLLAGLFTFILINNWSGLLPGVGAFGYYDEQGHLDYWMRPGNADLNMTIALAIVHFIAWFYYIMRYAGPGTVLYDLFGNKAERREIPGLIYLFVTFVFLCVGFIEVISILIRPISLSFRLFGNIFGGENLLASMIGLGGVASYIAPVPFYFLELLIGFVQALVFTLLVAVYIGLICNHDAEQHERGAEQAVAPGAAH